MQYPQEPLPEISATVPKWIQVEHPADGLIIQIKAHGFGRFLGPIIMLAWTIMVTLFFIDTGFRYALLLIVFGFIGLVKTVIDIWAVKVIHINKDKLIVASKPISRTKDFQLPVNVIKQIYCQEKRKTVTREVGEFTREYTVTYYELYALERGSGRHIFLFEMDNKECILYIERELERYLRIIDTPVLEEKSLKYN